MKIRSLIFLFVFALGLLPLVFLELLNLPKTIDRLQYSAELETQARSHVDFTRLNARIRCLKKSLLRSASLPQAVLKLQGKKSPELGTVFYRWFVDDVQILGVYLLNRAGNLQFTMERNSDTFAVFPSSGNYAGNDFFANSLPLSENDIHVQLVSAVNDPLKIEQQHGYRLLMCAPVIKSGNQSSGVIVMRIDLSEFLIDHEDTIWVTGKGEYLRGCPEITTAPPHHSDSIAGNPTDDKNSCIPFRDFPGLEEKISRLEPLILTSIENNKTAWMPLVFSEKTDAVMWVGSPVDESAVQQWKRSLLINALAIISMMFVLVYFSANWLAMRIDRLRTDLVDGLDTLMNKEKKVSFHWNGPQEITLLSDDLTELGDKYITTFNARKKAEAALRESEDKFRSLTGSALDSIILMDHEGKVAYWNEAAGRMFGYSIEEAIGKPVHSLIETRRDEEELGNNITSNDNLDPAIGQTVIMYVRHKDGHELPVELSLSSTSINNEWHAIWIVRDISERRRAEERSRRQQQQLLQADKMISLGLLVSGVAHEINNPNSIALLNLPMLRRSWESVKPILDEYYEENGDFTVSGIDYSTMRQQLPRLCSELEESAQRIREIVVDLKDYARQEGSGTSDPVSVNDVVQASVRLTANSVKKASADFSVTYAENLPLVQGNRQRLIQVVINLIQNSCEALEGRKGSITVATRYAPENDSIEIIVTDDGIGIKEDVIHQVTDPFFTTKRNMGGTGLGLAVSAGIIKDHNGVLRFFSEENQGTVVTVMLPALHEE